MPARIRFRKLKSAAEAVPLRGASRAEFLSVVTGAVPVPGSPEAGRSLDPAAPRPKGRVRSLRRHGEMTAAEARFAETILDPMLRRGEIVRYDYEPEVLRLPGCRYTPDFRVLAADGEVVFYEIKGGRCEEDSWLKLKLAAEIHPYRFVLVKARSKREAIAIGEAWEIREVRGSGGWSPSRPTAAPGASDARRSTG